MNPTDSAQLERMVRCPTCGGDSVYSLKNEARPFCSVRCKNVDLGAWAHEDFRVPESSTPSDTSDGN